MPEGNKNAKQLTEAMNKIAAGSSRLNSFGKKRDLSLAGPSKPKRPALKPNLITRKSKNERAIDEALKNHGKAINKSDKSAYKSKSHSKDRNLVQIKGSLYDDRGLTEHKIKLGLGGNRFSSNYQSSSTKQSTQVFTQPTQFKVDSTENSISEDLFGKFSLNDYEDDDFDAGLLPYDICPHKSNIKTEKKHDIIGSFEKLKVKQEPRDEDDLSLNTDKDENFSVAKHIEMKNNVEKSLAERILSESEELMCFSFPATMPGILPAQAPKIVSANTVNESEKQSPLDKIAAKQLPTDRFKFEHITPGQIGSLKVYKSGKVELVLNSHSFVAGDVSYGGMHQELAYVNLSEDKKTGKLSVLGNIASNYSFTPDVFGMMKQ